MRTFSRSLLAVFLVALGLAACPAPAKASPPADTNVTVIAVMRATASATYSCSGPASCVFSAVVDSVSGSTVLPATTLTPGQQATATFACPATGGALVWKNTVVGRTTGLLDSPASPLRTSGPGCPVATSPGAVVVVTPITVGGP